MRFNELHFPFSYRHKQSSTSVPSEYVELEFVPSATSPKQQLSPLVNYIPPDRPAHLFRQTYQYSTPPFQAQQHPVAPLHDAIESLVEPTTTLPSSDAPS